MSAMLSSVSLESMRAFKSACFRVNPKAWHPTTPHSILVAAPATAAARRLAARLANGDPDLLLIRNHHAVAFRVLHDFRLALIDAALNRVWPLFLLHHAHGNLDFPVFRDLLHDAALDRIRSLLLLHHADANLDFAVLGN